MSLVTTVAGRMFRLRPALTTKIESDPDKCVNSEGGGNGQMVDPFQARVSPRYRSQCRPGTGTAS